MVTQAQRTASARGRLIAAASELVSTHGSGESSLMQIGERAGLSRGAVNFHFGSKAALLEEVLTQASRQCKQQRLKPTDLAGLFSDNHRAWFADPARARFIPMVFTEGLTAQTPELRAPMIELGGRWRVGVASSLEHLQAHDIVRSDIDVPSESTVIVALLLGLVTQHLADPTFDHESAYLTFCATTTTHLQSMPSPSVPTVPPPHRVRS